MLIQKLPELYYYRHLTNILYFYFPLEKFLNNFEKSDDVTTSELSELQKVLAMLKSKI